MEPQEFFHDHPVIDEREDGIYIYWTPLPPILLKNPPRIRYPTDEDENPPEW